MNRQIAPSAPDLYQADPSQLAANHSTRLSTSQVGNGFLGNNLEPGSSQANSITIERPVYTQPHFDEVIADNQPDPRYSKSARERLDGFKSKCACSVTCVKDFLFRILPFIRIMKDYNIKTDLVSDLLAGLTVGIMQIPQGQFWPTRPTRTRNIPNPKRPFEAEIACAYHWEKT